MIVVVDDEPSVLEFLRRTLEYAGHEVHAFGAPHDALDYLASHEPDLIISDVMMPDMDGFAFRKAYADLIAHPPAPFVFLSCMTDADSIVKGLGEGADDYLEKPIRKAVLCAKVAAILRRRQRWMQPTFAGELSAFPFVKLLQFCERKGISGHVEVRRGGRSTRVRLRGGQIEDIGSEILEDLLEAREGSFVVCCDPIDFSELSPSTEELEAAPQAPPESEQVMGRLSGIQIKDRILQLQTEFVASAREVVTLVINDGKAVFQRRTAVVDGAGREAIAQQINEQHASLEQEVQEKIQTLAQRASGPAEETFDHLYEDAVARLLQRDYASAVSLLERAQALQPQHKLVAVNLTLARKKLGPTA
jgi:DNA-binding response OmpR family regulator